MRSRPIIIAVACVAASAMLFFGRGRRAPIAADAPTVDALRAALFTVLEEQGPGEAVAFLKKEAGSRPALLRDCHPLLHELGRRAFKKNNDFTEAIRHDDGFCNAGYLHGVIEAYVGESRDFEAAVRNACAGVEEGTFRGWSCFHGIGHGIMYFAANDLPRSLAACEGLPHEFGRTACANGAFMENFLADGNDHFSAYVSPEDPFSTCRNVDGRYKNHCYIYVPAYYLLLHPGDYGGTLRWCDGAEPGYAGACAHGVGTQAVKEHIDEPLVAERACMSADGREMAEQCLRGMTSLYINHHGSTGPARDLCDRMEAANARICRGMIAEKQPLFPDAREGR